MNAQRYKTLLSTAAGIAVAATVTLTVQAEELNIGSRVPTQAEIINHLKPQAPANQATSRTRGIKLMNQPQAAQPPANQQGQSGETQQTAAAAEQPQAAAPQQAEPVAISMEVLFDFNSAQLTNAAMEQLHPLGQALQSPELQGLRFVLEGHTDATGSEEYNLVLSQRRATAVKQHLAQNYGIDPRTLDALGRGEFSLLDPNNPADGINRRVRIVSQNY